MGVVVVVMVVVVEEGTRAATWYSPVALCMTDLYCLGCCAERRKAKAVTKLYSLLYAYLNHFLLAAVRERWKGRLDFCSYISKNLLKGVHMIRNFNQFIIFHLGSIEFFKKSTNLSRFKVFLPDQTKNKITIQFNSSPILKTL